MVAAGVAGVAVGVVLGLALGGGDDDSDPLQGVRDARSSLQRSANLLDIVAVEYAEGIEDGRVVSNPEHAGSRRAFDRSLELFSEARPVVEYVDAGQATRIDHGFAGLGSDLGDRVDERRVEARARALAGALEEAIGRGR